MGDLCLDLPGIKPGPPLSWEMSIFFSIYVILFLISIKIYDFFLLFSNPCKHNSKTHYTVKPVLCDLQREH